MAGGRGRRASWIAAALAVAFGSACQRHADNPDAQAARAAVARYNQALVEAFRTMEQDRLVHVATEAEVSRVGAVIAGLMAQGKVMQARQVDSRVEEVKVLAPDLAEVLTRESWSYEHRTLADRDRPAELKRVTYRMSYQVKKKDAAWLVQHAQVREESPPR